MSNSGKLVALKRHFYDLSGDVRLQEVSFSGGLTLTLKYHNLIITCLRFFVFVMSGLLQKSLCKHGSWKI